MNFKKYSINNIFKLGLLVVFTLGFISKTSAQKKEERRIERFFISASGGIVFPIAGDYKKLEIGGNYIIKGGFRWKFNDRGGMAWSVGYSVCNSTIVRKTNYFYGYYTGPIELKEKIRISRFDISLLDLFKLYGKNDEGYFHVAINLVINQNTFTYDASEQSASGLTVAPYTEKQKSEFGFATEYGLHMPVSDHFGISLDLAAVIIKLGKEETSYISYSTTSTTAQGFYGYVNLGLVYGIW